jgi:hypothetical protein
VGEKANRRREPQILCDLSTSTGQRVHLLSFETARLPCNRAPLRTRTLVFLIQWLGRSLEKRPSVCVEPAPLAAVVTVARSPRGRARPDTLARSRRSRVGFS